MNSDFAVGETVAELTPDVFTQGLFFSSNAEHDSASVVRSFALWLTHNQRKLPTDSGSHPE